MSSNFFRKCPLRKCFLGILLLCMFTHPGSSQTSEMIAAAEKGDPEAQYLLAKAYLQGSDAAPDYQSALKWSTASAKQGFSPAQFLLGYQYFEGLGTTRNYEEAGTWFMKAGEDINELERAWLPSWYYLSLMTSYGLGMEKAEAYAHWYAESAAYYNYPRAQHLLGLYYEAGRGVEKDFRKAYYNYKMAAEQGYAPAQTSLATMYFYQKGVEFDREEVMKWFTLAAEQDNAVAQRNLGLISEYGFKDNPKRDLKKAHYWYSKAAENGDAEAMFWMGDYMSNQNQEKEAKAWYEKAAYLGNEDAMQRLGEWYNSSIGVTEEEDISKSVYWHQQAAKKNQPRSLLRLGDYYLFGIGVKKDERKALEYYLKGHQQGYSIGDGSLNKLSQSSDPEIAAIGRRLLREDREFSASYARSAFSPEPELTSGEESVITGILLLSGLLVLADHLAPSGQQGAALQGYSNSGNEEFSKMRQQHIQTMIELELLPTY